jgi:acetyl-CoA acetyltransferase
MIAPVIAGVGMTRFTKQAERGYAGMAHEAIRAALSDAGLEARQVGAVFCGSVVGGPGIGQQCVKDLGFVGVPVTNIENACASSSSALREAIAWIAAGFCDVALAFGTEILSPANGPLGVARMNWMYSTGLNLPGWYALQACEYISTYGASVEDLAYVAVKSRSVAALNPRAHFQALTSVDEVLSSIMIAEPLTRNQCCPKTDGASAVIVVSPEWARRNGVKGVTIRSSSIGGGVPVFTNILNQESTATRTCRQALALAGIEPKDIDVAEVHDAFTIGEILYAEALGILPKGEGAVRTARGETLPNVGRVAINPSGGLLSRGHPLGASGLAMVFEIVEQLRGNAGQRQVSNARIGATVTMGANEFELDTNVCAVFVMEAG